MKLQFACQKLTEGYENNIFERVQPTFYFYNPLLVKQINICIMLKESQVLLMIINRLISTGE